MISNDRVTMTQAEPGVSFALNQRAVASSPTSMQHDYERSDDAMQCPIAQL